MTLTNLKCRKPAADIGLLLLKQMMHGFFHINIEQILIRFVKQQATQTA